LRFEIEVSDSKSEIRDEIRALKTTEVRVPLNQDVLETEEILSGKRIET
jgi:hypothetical protein